jgi:hypothetical protein
MVIVRNKIFPFKGFKAVNIFGFLFCRPNAVIGWKTINHESIHTAQMKELLYIGFYLIYWVEYLIHAAHYFDLDKAYHEISFEKEALSHVDEVDYLSTRKHYAQWRNH